MDILLEPLIKLFSLWDEFDDFLDIELVHETRANFFEKLLKFLMKLFQPSEVSCKRF